LLPLQLLRLMGESAFDLHAGLQQSLPATTAAEAVTQHWLQALDHGQGTATDAGHPYKLFQGLAVARRALVQAHAAQGVAGLLQTCPATVAALQGVLPFMRPPHQLIAQQPSLQEAPQQQQQQQSNLSSSSNNSSSCLPSGTPNSAVSPAPVLQAPAGSSSSASIGQQLDGMGTASQTSTKLPSLLDLLPPAQQAWLVADVVAGLLLHQHANDASSSSANSSSDRHNNNNSSSSSSSNSRR
jgi:hypothetical protein